jgi:hypothetical protein
MHKQWIAMEHYRLHCAEQWPASPYKRTVIEAIHSTLKALRTASPAPLQQPECAYCASKVVELGRGTHSSPARSQLAA